MVSGIDRGLTVAWQAGAAQCGLKPDELSPLEVQELRAMINSQLPFLNGFGQNIVDNSKANGGRLTPLLQRGEMWVNQAESARLKGQAMACADLKMMWQVGPTEHCRTCLKLNGKVKRMSFWNTHVLPRNAPNLRLECRGFKCQCMLIKTDQPLSRGPLGNLP